MPSVLDKIKDAQVIDLHLLVQAVLYLTAVLAGLTALAPLSLERTGFGGNCLLYATFTTNGSQPFVHLHKQGACSFAVTVEGVISMLYALGMTAYFFYALKKSQVDIQIASLMWVMPFLLVNCLVLFLVFLAACIISVGFKSFCDDIVANTPLTRCSDVRHGYDVTLADADNKFNIASFFKLMSTAEIASWVVVIVWIAQCILTALRLERNRRLRSSEAMQDIASAQPTA